VSSDRAFFQLLRLASPGLPIGAYCYSQGLESALDAGLVRDADSAHHWLRDVLLGPVAHFDAALVAQAYRAAVSGDEAGVCAINARYLAARETAEQRLETCQMGYSLTTLLRALPEGEEMYWPAALGGTTTFPVAWALAAHRLGVAPAAATGAFVYGWLENQVLVLMKAMPLGHTAAQRLTSSLLPSLEEAARIAMSLPQGEFSNFAPMLGWAAMRHETQYSRLFRS